MSAGELGYAEDGSLPVAAMRATDVADWPTFPFAGPVTPRPLEAPVIPEPLRGGVEAAECGSCTRPDDGYLWVDDRWRVQAAAPLGLPMLVFLTPRAHFDTPDLPLELTSELGTIVQRIERAILGLGGVARVHLSKWGDGGYHAHYWIYGRPEGYLQLRGTFATLWDDLLPVTSDDVWAERCDRVAAALVAGGGRRPS